MTDHTRLLDRYLQIRDVRYRLNNQLAGLIPKKTLEECARRLGLMKQGILVFDSESEMSILMDYCIYYPTAGRPSLVARYLKTSPPADSQERAIVEAMTRSYYSLLQVKDVERGVGVSAHDLLRDEDVFLVDVGFGNTAKRHMMLATRIIPMDDLFMTGGAALPIDATAARRILNDLTKAKLTPESIDFDQISPERDAEVSALIIRACRAAGTTSKIEYAPPGGASSESPTVEASLRDRRNLPCPCGRARNTDRATVGVSPQASRRIRQEEPSPRGGDPADGELLRDPLKERCRRRSFLRS